MRGIDINEIAEEITSTMKNNFSGTSEQRYQKAKKLFLECVSEMITQNKREIKREAEE